MTAIPLGSNHMDKQVKGTLFIDYVRMIRKLKDVDWTRYLTPEDMKIIGEMILPSQWHPLETYQNMGVAVFHEIAKGEVDVVSSWGRASMDELVKVYKTMANQGQPIDSMKKFQALRSRFFNFEILQITDHKDNHVSITVDIAFERIAETAYAYQMLGSFERLLELSGANTIKHEFANKAWEGDPNTVIELSWE